MLAPGECHSTQNVQDAEIHAFLFQIYFVFILNSNSFLVFFSQKCLHTFNICKNNKTNILLK